MNIWLYAAAVVAFSCAFDASAEDHVDCKEENFKVATSLVQLPPQILAALKAPGQLADHGQPFNPTDVLVDAMPMRRFAIGAVGSGRAFAATEEGGDGLHVEIWRFERDVANWKVAQSSYSVVPPSSLPELLYSTCFGYGLHEPHGHVKSIVGSLSPDGSTWLSFNGIDKKPMAYSLRESGKVSPGMAIYAPIERGVLASNDVGHQLSERDRRQLRSKLRTLQSSIDKDDDVTRRAVARFLVALSEVPAFAH